MQSIRALTALSLAVAGIFFIAPATASTLMQKDSAVINTLFSQIKPQCIGRYVIDVPASFNNQLHDMVFIDDFKIESKPLYLSLFAQKLGIKIFASKGTMEIQAQGDEMTLDALKDKEYGLAYRE